MRTDLHMYRQSLYNSDTRQKWPFRKEERVVYLVMLWWPEYGIRSIEIDGWCGASVVSNGFFYWSGLYQVFLTLDEAVKQTLSCLKGRMCEKKHELEEHAHGIKCIDVLGDNMWRGLSRVQIDMNIKYFRNNMAAIYDEIIRLEGGYYENI